MTNLNKVKFILAEKEKTGKWLDKEMPKINLKKFLSVAEFDKQ